MLVKKRSFVQTQKAKKAKELGRGHHQPAKGRGKTFSSTSTGRQPFKTGHYKMTIEEVKKVTRSGHCHRVGHWHRECPDLQKGNHEKEQHFLEEATFCGLLEREERATLSPMTAAADPGLQQPEGELRGLNSKSHETGTNRATGTSETGSLRSAVDFEPKTGQPVSTYNDRRVDDDWEVFLRETGSHTFQGSIGNPRLDHGNQNSPEEACATVDTGCQRMAIGVETLRKLAQHLPCELPVRLQHQEHRFRSAHGRSVTKQVAMIPTGLGKKGSVLKPAVFENDESKHAPFLISLSFLMFCRAVIF